VILLLFACELECFSLSFSLSLFSHHDTRLLSTFAGFGRIRQKGVCSQRKQSSTRNAISEERACSSRKPRRSWSSSQCMHREITRTNIPDLSHQRSLKSTTRYQLEKKDVTSTSISKAEARSHPVFIRTPRSSRHLTHSRRCRCRWHAFQPGIVRHGQLCPSRSRLC